MAAEATRSTRLRDDADFRRYWWARTLSTTGTVITLIALPVLVYRLSGSAFLTALVSALEAAPYVIFGLFAGALSDRWNRRLLMVNADGSHRLTPWCTGRPPLSRA
ncbi:MAG: MFS transporter [Propionibacteriales bacterium]|nr:MFS transporter [Propionibacteriales bacterium]